MASSTPSTSILRPFNFMDFAGEIRNQIYRECLLVDRWTLATSPSSWGLFPSIMRLNHQIYNETFTILWSENSWLTLKGDDRVMRMLENRYLNSRKTPHNPLPFNLVVCRILALEIDWAYDDPDTDPRAYKKLRPTRLINVLELPAFYRAVMDLTNNPPIKVRAYIDSRKPKATDLLRELVNWSLFNTSKYDRSLGPHAIHPSTQISIFGAKDEVIHPDLGERLDLPWYTHENISGAARMWQHRIQEAEEDLWLERCIHLDQYTLFAKVTSHPSIMHGYGPKEVIEWQHHVVSLGHYVGRASLGLRDPKHATDFLANIWRWNPLKLDGAANLKADMAETHHLMYEGLRLQGQHIASLVHLVQALMLWNDHAEATAAATNLIRDHSAVGPDEHECFVYNLHNILDPLLWGLPVERSVILRRENKTLPFPKFKFPEGWEIHWDWASKMKVPFVHLRIEYPQHPPS